jgi:hypothetical protein
MLSFLGPVMFVFGAGSLPGFVACILGALANALMIAIFFQIIRDRVVPVPIIAATLALTLAVPVALSYVGQRSIGDMVSFGYFAWTGCAALLMAASIVQPKFLPGPGDGTRSSD